MKRCIPIFLALLLLTACGAAGQTPASGPSSSQGGGKVISDGGDRSPSSGSAPEQPSQAQTDGPSADPSEELLSIAADFAESFPIPFSSPEELVSVERFCLLKIYYEDPAAISEDGQWSWISRERLEEEVRRRFDLPDYRFRSPEQENVYPRYVEEKGAIAFSLAGGGNWLTAVLTGQAAEGEYYSYTFDLYDDVITDEHPERTLEKTLRYRFRVVETAGGRLSLQAVSAAELSAVYRYDELPGFPLPDIVPQKIKYHNVLIGDEITLLDAELIEQTMELLGRVELCGPPFRVEEGAEPDRVVSFYQNPEEEEPAYSLCFLEDGSMYIETAESRSEAYSTLNWSGTGEGDGLALRLGRRIRVWISPDDPNHPLPKGTLYTVKGSPFFHPSFDDVKKIYYHDAALGEDWTVTDPQVIEKIVKKIKYFTFYDEPAPAVPETDTFRYQCFEYFAFYENEEDDTPIFSMGLNPFYVKIGEEKFGPYAVDILDDEITELLKLFL